MNDGDTLADGEEVLQRCPYDVLRVERSATKREIQRAYRRQARLLHPDVSGSGSAEQFRELVIAFKEVVSRQPGSRETHPLWPYLSTLDQYWSREQGHDTAEQLEQYLKDLGKYDEYLGEHRLALAAPAAVDEDSDTGGSAILALTGYRIFLGNEQWQVSWACDGGEATSSWERFGVLNTEPLRREAERLRAEANVRVAE